MKILGLIVEYNPFHHGHLYHLNKAKELLNPDLTIAVMSSHFVQRGEPAISDKWTRAQIAIKNGVDLVIELPFVYSVQSADYFAHGAIDILAKLKVTDIVFGSENGDINIFNDIAYTIKNNQKAYNNIVKEQMNLGLRYPDACNQALSLLMNKTVTTPNDLLGLAYVKEIIDHDYPIEMHCIKRTNDFHSLQIEAISSASAIRHALKNKIDIKNQFCNYKEYKEFYFLDDFYPYLRYKILTTSNQSLKQLHLVDEGIENLLKEKILVSNNMEQLITNLSSKRYTRSRIQRMLIHILMNNTKDQIINAMHLNYIRILKMNNNGQAYLNKIKKVCEYKLITNFSSYTHPALDLEFKATKLLSCLSINPNKLVELEYKSIPK
ncbi:nucleotidyltransferase [Thomasclavelia cocleata]|uniref:tRNA(Met) cytidine acetate ligase n=1 Tax=Thomasclavelia cocleata TaxID=69824 RepID=A0A1I0GVB0_9FIRM|nr:nucleotidyltransferase [Thomasclavelia cocleata]MCR1961748.1 nucleotidyltransferase [Thomasclavelia cocleata]NDO43371.1 nucleotidyltransferase [Thomasclavelia cocleata]PJN80612.1 nucleotidyltransferase [Thomasclavelia cocleata]SET75078.1 Predicted nucleotidyltransferase [Thomasclavelia cocleata]